MSQRPELKPEERAFSYSKYYDLPITPIPEDKGRILAGGPMDPADALPIERRGELLNPGYFPVEIGYCVMENGTGYLANLTEMPGVTPEMFEWWMAWHALEDLRYRIWDPEDHFYARQQMREKVLDPGVPMREKTWGTVHDILEDVGGGPDRLILEFRYPHELGYDEEKVGTKLCATMMCANGHGPVPGEGVAAIMTHMVREIKGGIELRSRFWIGYGLVDGNVVKLLPDGVCVPEIVPKGLFAHNLKEFGHLAAILPSVYEEEKDNW
jgi:hypothetical protein